MPDPGLVLGWCAELALLSLALVGLCRLAWDRLVLFLTLGSFVVRMAIGQALYVISALRLPLLRDLQLPGGFWRFGYDALISDLQAKAIFELASGSRIGAIQGAINQTSRTLEAGLHVDPGSLNLLPFSRVVTFLYAVFGANPPQGLLFVAAAAAGCTPLAFLAARSMGLSRRSSLLGAAVVALWPSSFIWSGQMLKDPFQWLGIFAAAAGATALLRAATRPGLTPLLVPALLIVAGEAIISLLRDYATSVWVIAVVLGLTAFIATKAGGTWRKTAAASAVLLAAVAAGNLPGGTTQLLAHKTWTAGGMLEDELHFRGIVVVGHVMEFFGSPPEIIPGPPARRGSGEPAGESGPPPPVLPKPANGGQPCAVAGALIVARQGFQTTQAASQVDPDQLPLTCGQILAYLPRAGELTFVSPLPNEWSQLGQSVGALKYLAPADVVFLWLIFPGFVLGLVRMVARRNSEALILGVYVLVLGLALGFAVTIFGALFRLRLQVVLLGAVLAVDGWTWAWHKLAETVRARRAAAATPAGVAPREAVELLPASRSEA